MMSQLTDKGIIRSFSMLKRRAAVKPLIGIISDCDVCGGFMFNAQRYMSKKDDYFAPSAICFPYEVKKVFDQILHELQYIHIILHWIWISWIGYSSTDLFRVEATPFPLPV